MNNYKTLSLTRDEILNMPAGREMDALIAEIVMGHAVKRDAVVWQMGRTFLEPFVEGFTTLGNYSTDISAAWEVAEKMFSCYWDLTLEAGSRSPLSMATFYRTTDQISFLGSAETAPLAICRAALLAVMDKQ